MTAIPALLYALGLGAQFLKGREENKYRKKMEAAQKEVEEKAERARKRAALASAIKYNDPTFQRKVETPEASDLSGYDLAAGLGSFGSTVASQRLGGPKTGGVDDILSQYPSALRRRFSPYA